MYRKSACQCMYESIKMWTQKEADMAGGMPADMDGENSQGSLKMFFEQPLMEVIKRFSNRSWRTEPRCSHHPLCFTMLAWWFLEAYIYIYVNIYIYVFFWLAVNNDFLAQIKSSYRYFGISRFGFQSVESGLGRLELFGQVIEFNPQVMAQDLLGRNWFRRLCNIFCCSTSKRHIFSITRGY